jgi:hypothetical protein
MSTAKALDKKELWRDIQRDERRKAREKLAELRGHIRTVRARRKRALHDAKERCRAERLAARERARSMRLRVLHELREAMRAERAAARQSCALRLGDARSIKNDIERARAELVAEREYQRELRRIETANRQRRREAPAITRIDRRTESDDEVRQNIPPDLVPLFDRVKRAIKATPRMSRTEAFLHYAEENPAEVLDVIEDKTEALIRELEAQQRATSRGAGRRVASLASLASAVRRKARPLHSDGYGASRALHSREAIAQALPSHPARRRPSDDDDDD